jgi:hypothetical protein
MTGVDLYLHLPFHYHNNLPVATTLPHPKLRSSSVLIICTASSLHRLIEKLRAAGGVAGRALVSGFVFKLAWETTLSMLKCDKNHLLLVGYTMDLLHLPGHEHQ